MSGASFGCPPGSSRSRLLPREVGRRDFRNDPGSSQHCQNTRVLRAKPYAEVPEIGRRRSTLIVLLRRMIARTAMMRRPDRLDQLAKIGLSAARQYHGTHRIAQLHHRSEI